MGCTPGSTRARKGSRVRNWYRRCEHLPRTVVIYDSADDPDMVAGYRQDGYTECSKCGKVLAGRWHRGSYVTLRLRRRSEAEMAGLRADAARLLERYRTFRGTGCAGPPGVY